jgi:hypothetical protein
MVISQKPTSGPCREDSLQLRNFRFVTRPLKSSASPAAPASDYRSDISGSTHRRECEFNLTRTGQRALIARTNFSATGSSQKAKIVGG